MISPAGPSSSPSFLDKIKSGAKFLKEVNFLSFNFERSSPAIFTLPLVGLSKQPIKFIMVDFPDPEGPTIATNSPLFIVKSFSSVLAQIFTILTIGLFFDIFNTWIHQNSNIFQIDIFLQLIKYFLSQIIAEDSSY